MVSLKSAIPDRVSIIRLNEVSSLLSPPIYKHRQQLKENTSIVLPIIDPWLHTQQLIRVHSHRYKQLRQNYTNVQNKRLPFLCLVLLVVKVISHIVVEGV